MMKHMFRRVKEGILAVGVASKKQVKRVKTKTKKIVAGSLFIALMPLPLLAFQVDSGAREPSTPSPPTGGWQTQLVLAESSPELLIRTEEAVAIEKAPSRYDEEQAIRQQAEAAARRKKQVEVVQQIASSTCNNNLSQEEKVALASQAAAAYGIPTQLLIAVWRVESGMQACTGVASHAGATGPFQFMPGTWRGYAVDGNGDGVKDVRDARDSAYAAARLLAANGAAQGDYYRALLRYNNADWYVKKVLAMAGM